MPRPASLPRGRPSHPDDEGHHEPSSYGEKQPTRGWRNRQFEPSRTRVNAFLPPSDHEREVTLRKETRAMGYVILAIVFVVLLFVLMRMRRGRRA